MGLPHYRFGLRLLFKRTVVNASVSTLEVLVTSKSILYARALQVEPSLTLTTRNHALQIMSIRPGKLLIA